MNPKYVVVEMQTNSDGQLGNLVSAYDDRNQAESKYHTVLAAAAVSALPIHSAVLLTADGRTLMSGVYVHTPTPEGE